MRVVCCFFLVAIMASVNVRMAAATLYGVTGDGATAPETLYTINTTTAALSFVQALGNGDDGEAITYHSPSGLLYHWSGLSPVMETVNPSTNDVTLVSSTGPAEIFSAVWDSAGGQFLVTNVDRGLYSVTVGGTYTLIGQVPNATAIGSSEIRGLAFAGSTLYALEHHDTFDGDDELDLLTIDKSTANVLSSINVSLGGFDLNGSSFGFVADGNIGEFYAGVGIGSSRRLVTIDPATGVATDVGLFSDMIASLATDAPPITAAIPESRWGMLMLALIIVLPAIARRMLIAAADRSAD